MTAATANVTLWGFAWYVRHNPFKTFGSMTEQDFLDMVKLFASENNAVSSTTTTDPGTYTNLTFPDSLTATQTTTICDQANYPEKHKGS
jgi:hypothetical protein